MRKLSKVLAVSMLSLSLTTSMGIVSWADSTTGIISQTDRWQGSGDSWKLLNESRTGYVTNSWFQDLDGSWYMLSQDGTMYSGLVTDQSTGKSYLLNTNHDGTYGRMLTQNGTYTVNGKSVYLTFDQTHNGTFGAILTGLSEARSTGISEVALPSIPTESTTSSQPQTNPSTPTPESQPEVHNPGHNNSGGLTQEQIAELFPGWEGGDLDAEDIGGELGAGAGNLFH